ncbi:leucyl/phenylalanyl-tRNA--protein transferase [Lamprobacter modestohalophilus]|nr:leucyl/phenylalanyl-tRNA--protein transferase [Lamprobacter modestohalophilus]MEA1049848.1 leucyl/phenylalanyl-tRNA--protein transferase [Lamprobacter modestohalophilus]
MPYLLAPNDPSGSFPDPAEAMRDPDGLLAVGGDLSNGRLINAYRHGIFPWYSEGDPILWWSPDPRTVLIPTELHCSRSLRKLLRRRVFAVTMDRDFPAVIRACAGPRPGSQGTWLLPEMISAYCGLHVHGIAHSIEVWQDGHLVGGLYGVAIGGAFFGESMFSRVDNASKVALVHLCEHLIRHKVELIDCQVLTSHLQRMGAELMPRERFLARLHALRDRPSPIGHWDDGQLHYPGCSDACSEACSDACSDERVCAD